MVEYASMRLKLVCAMAVRLPMASDSTARIINMGCQSAASAQVPRYDRCAIVQIHRCTRPAASHSGCSDGGNVLLPFCRVPRAARSIEAFVARWEEHTSALQSLMRI